MINRLYAGRLITEVTPTDPDGTIVFEHHAEVEALGGGSSVFATWDNRALNPNGNPQALTKTLNVLVIISLPSQVEFDQFNLLAGIYNVQDVLARGNPAYTEIVADYQSGQSVKQAAILQLRSVTNSVFTAPERNQLKQEFPLIQTATATIHDTFIPVLEQDAHIADFTYDITRGWEKVAAIYNNITITLPASGTVTIIRVDTFTFTVTLNPGANSTLLNTVAGNTTTVLTLINGVWTPA